jgi:hypothetical protein
MDGSLAYGSTLYLLILVWFACPLFQPLLAYPKTHPERAHHMPAEFRTFVTATGPATGHPDAGQHLALFPDRRPLTLGFLKPVILLPVAMISHLTLQQIEAILIHELGHIRGKDYLLHLLVTLLEGLFFFNPFSRLLIRQLKKEREHCCDDLVLQFKYDPHAYVSALLSLAARQQYAHQFAVAATGSGDKLLLQRARRVLLQQEEDRSRPGIRTLILLLFTGVIAALALYRSLLPVRRAEPAIAQTPVAPSAIPAATTREIVFSRRILSTPPPIASAHQHQPARPRIHITREPATLQTDDNDIFVNAADDVTGDGGTTALVASGDDLTDPAPTRPGPITATIP